MNKLILLMFFMVIIQICLTSFYLGNFLSLSLFFSSVIFIFFKFLFMYGLASFFSFVYCEVLFLLSTFFNLGDFMKDISTPCGFYVMAHVVFILHVLMKNKMNFLKQKEQIDKEVEYKVVYSSKEEKMLIVSINSLEEEEVEEVEEEVVVEVLDLFEEFVNMFL